MGKFLRICFGCHGRPDRSFFFRGKQFPICARCTGELIGIFAGIPIFILLGCPKPLIVFLLMVPLIFDGFLQQLTSYESGNIRRLITGFLFGTALVFCFIYFHRFCVQLAAMVLSHYIEDQDKLNKAVDLFLLK